MSVHSQLRRRFPALTPGFFPDDEDELAVRLPRLQPTDEADIDKIFRLGAPPDIPALTRTAAPLPTSEAEIPLLSRPLEVPHQPTRPTVTYDQSGRPTPRVFGTDDPETRVLARRRALEEYQPQKESKKMLALRTLLNFVGGGIPGAAQTLIGPGGVMDRRGVDRAWQREQLGQVDEQWGRLRTDRRAGLQDRLLNEQVEKAERPEIPKLIRMPNPDNPSQDILVPERPNLQIPVRPPAVRPPTGFNLSPGQRRIEYVDGKPTVVYEAPANERTTGEETPGQLRARQGQFRAAQKKFNDLVEEEKRAAQRKDAAYAKASTLRDWYNNPSRKAVYDEKGVLVSPAVAGRAPAGQEPFEEDVKAAEKAADDAQRYYESLGGKKSEAEAEMLQYGDVDDKGSPRAPSGFNPTEQLIYDAAAKNPKTDPDEAVKRYREGKRAGKF